MPEIIDWTRFELRIKVKASMPLVYDAWSTRQGMEKWFLRQCGYMRSGNALPANSQVRRGDTYHWLWHGWPDDVEENGEILDADGAETFAFKFGAAGKVSVHLQAHDDAVMLRLLQYEIPDTEAGRHHWHTGCKTGWTFYLTNLKAVLETGIDLRNRETGIPNVVNG